ncbi:MAG: hypothetical protein IJ308_01850 [Clostridia bacterium]|nr:hypothetical protein [Clostridia bacterium]
MKNKKNFLCALILAGLLSVSMTGCFGGDDSIDTSNDSSGTNSESTSDDTGSENDSSSDGGSEVVHKTYEEIEGEIVRVVEPIPEENVKGYSVKICPCGEELQGDYTVIVTVNLNGANLAVQTVKVGNGLAELPLPTRDGYTLMLYKNGEEYALTETFDDFATVELTSRWFYTETNYDYKTDAEAKVAALPTEASAENAETLLAQIAEIETIVNTHYTEEEKADAASLAELKAAAETIVSAPEYQLNKKLTAIPEFEEMTDEVETLYAVLDYITYYNSVKEELVDYSEPRKISIYKHYFSGKDVVITDLYSRVETNATYENDKLVMTGAEDNAYTFTLPKLPYAMFTGMRTIATFGQPPENIAAGYTIEAYGETLINAMQKAWFWFEIIVEEGGVYLSVYDTDTTSGEKYVLPDAVANGAEGLTFTVKTAGAWDYLAFRQDGSVAADNMVGKLAEIPNQATVRTVTYSYKDGEGEQTLTQYYLDGESLALPQLNISYADNVGTHTLSGWGETADVVMGDLAYTATYETVYKNYAVTFLDATYGVFEEKTDYHYGDKVVLPTTTPEKAKEGDWKFEFIGWYNGEDEVNGETLVEKNMEIEPRFKSVYDGACYVLTIESEGLETQTYNIPALTDLQAEALLEIPALERDRYTFAGYTNKETGEEVDFASLVISSDITLVAKWTPNYIAMAAALPATAEEITDENQTYSDLLTYLSYVANNPVEEYEEPANIAALKAHYAGARKIYTFTSTSDSNIGTSARFEKVDDKSDTWYQDDQGNPYGGYIQVTFDTADGEGYIVLPKINYALYSEVSFGVFGLGANNAVQLSINGNGGTLDNTGNIYYVVEIHGKDVEVHNMNGVTTLFTATLTDAQYNGTEGLKLTVTESGWSCVQVSHILGQLAVEETEEPEEPEVVSPTAISGVMTSVTTNATYEAANGLVMSGATDNTYTFTLSKVKYCNYTEVSMITVFGGANTSYTFNAYGTNFENISTTWNWFKVIRVGAEGKTVKDTDTGADIVLSEGYYLTIGNTDVGSEWYTYVKLSDAVVNGEEGLTFSVTTGQGKWDWIKFRQDGSVETDNFVGTLA